MFRDHLLRWGRALVAAIFFAQLSISAVNLATAARNYANPPPPSFPLSAPLHPSEYTASPGYLLSAAFVGGAVGFRLAWRRAS